MITSYHNLQKATHYHNT